MRKNRLEVVQTISIDDRWKENVSYDPRSLEIVSFIDYYDQKFNGGLLGEKLERCGGHLPELFTYMLDEYFAAVDRASEDS